MRTLQASTGRLPVRLTQSVVHLVPSHPSGIGQPLTLLQSGDFSRLDNRSKEDSMSRLKGITRIASVLSMAFGLCMAAPAVGQEVSERPPRAERTGERPDPAEMLERRVSSLTERLELNPRQQTGVRAILAREQERRQEIIGANGPGGSAGRVARPSEAEREEMHERMRQSRAETESDIAAMLDAHQLARYREMQAESQGREGAPADRGGRQRGETAN